MNRLLRYLIINGLIVITIYYGMYKGNGGALNIAVFSLWFISISSLLLLNNTVVEQIGDKILQTTVPPIFDRIVDLGIVLSIIYKGYFWLGGFYIFHLILVKSARERAEKLMKKEN